MEEENKQGEFKWEELVCANCSDLGLSIGNCPKHGRDYIAFKCKFCCAVAQWFCFGTTHFCEPCHRNAFNCQPTECKGKLTCPLKIDHPPNGTEYCLGCTLCRNVMNSNLDF